MNYIDLKTYIENCYYLEVSLYKQNALYCKIENLITNDKQWKPGELLEKKKIDSLGNGNSYFSSAILGCILGIIIAGFLPIGGSSYRIFGMGALLGVLCGLVGIIFQKYRNLIAISSIYEYFESGRCNCLEGYEGAYNIYEIEIRQNVINNKLDEVIRHLDRIEQNQFMLYSAIKESNRNAQKIGQQICNIADGIKVVESNAQISAYNSRITAQNTEFLSWMESMRALNVH